MKKTKWYRKLFLRRALIILAMLVQAWLMVDILLDLSRWSPLISTLHSLSSFAVVIYITSRRNKSAFKTSWIVLVLVFPLFGGVLYLLFNFQSTTRQLRMEIEAAQRDFEPHFQLSAGSMADAARQFPSHEPVIRYLQDYAKFPVWEHTQTQYLSPGERMLEALLPELEKAERYIFIETFILEEGLMWNSILEVLKRKAAQGVLVRILYDDMGCFLTLPPDYVQTLAEYSIEAAVVNPFKPFLTVKQNNRDHRKITVIDGRVAFTGGINLADEYINAVEKYGHWKDSAIMLKGDAAWSFALIFLQMWRLVTKREEELSQYRPSPDTCLSDGFVQPYADSPTDDDNVGEHVYLQIINNAKGYLYINTPYLIVDDSMISALCLAAKSGVDVRIITPHKWDKRIVHITTRSYYQELIRSGVKIYEYTIGFNPAKTFVSDDAVATVGTTNLDFRSLYHHFECGTVVYGSRAVMEVKEDFLNTLTICHQITQEDLRSNVFMRMLQDVLRLFAPLM